MGFTSTVKIVAAELKQLMRALTKLHSIAAIIKPGNIVIFVMEMRKNVFGGILVSRKTF